MKKVVSVLSILAVIAFSVSMVGCSNTQKPEKVLRHVVMFGFKRMCPRRTVKEVEDAFCKLPSQIDLIKGYEWGHGIVVRRDCNRAGLIAFSLTFHFGCGIGTPMWYIRRIEDLARWLRGRGIVGGFGVGLLERNKKNGRDEFNESPARFYILSYFKVLI